MALIGFLFILFAFTIIAYPAILAYIVAGVFLMIGLQILRLSGVWKRSGQTSWNIGGYEIHRKR